MQMLFIGDNRIGLHTFQENSSQRFKNAKYFIEPEADNCKIGGFRN